MTDIKTVPITMHMTVKQDVIYLMEGDGTWSTDGGDDNRYGYGTAGTNFVAYMPDGKSVSIPVQELIEAGTAALKELHGD